MIELFPKVTKHQSFTGKEVITILIWEVKKENQMAIFKVTLCRGTNVILDGYKRDNDKKVVINAEEWELIMLAFHLRAVHWDGPSNRVFSTAWLRCVKYPLYLLLKTNGLVKRYMITYTI